MLRNQTMQREIHCSYWIEIGFGIVTEIVRNGSSGSFPFPYPYLYPVQSNPFPFPFPFPFHCWIVYHLKTDSERMEKVNHYCYSWIESEPTSGSEPETELQSGSESKY